MQLPFSAENQLEAEIIADPAWQEGARWGEPRPGHPEGSVARRFAEGYVGGPELLNVIELDDEAYNKQLGEGLRRFEELITGSPVRR
jgi:hypothetical protein